MLASISLDDIVKIIDVSHLGNRDKEEFDEEEYERDIQENPKIKRKVKKAKKNDDGDDQMMDEEERKSGDEEGAWESDSSDYGSSDDSDSDGDQGMKGREGKKDKKLNVKGINVKKSKKIIDNAKRMQFFSDL